MAQLILNFSFSNIPILVSVEFEHPRCIRKCHALRTRDASGLVQQGTFQWSKAVRGLIAYILREAAAQRLQPPSTVGSLEGASASSIAYALEKKPQWLLDMFGEDESGVPVLRHLLLRSNASQRPGRPTILRWKKWTFESLEVVVKSSEDTIIPETQWTELANKIEGQKGRHSWSRSQHQIQPAIEPMVALGWRKKLAAILEMEVVRALHQDSGTLFQGSQVQLKRLQEDADYNSQLHTLLKCSGLKTACEEVAVSKFFTAEAELQIERHLRHGPAIRVAVGAIPTANTLLLYYLKLIKRIPLEIDDRYFHTADLVHKLQSGSIPELPQIIPGGFAPLISLYQSKLVGEYKLYRYMPPHTVRSVGRATTESKGSTNLVRAYQSSDVSSEGLYLSRLRRANIDGAKRNAPLPTSLSVGELQSLDSSTRVVAFFPFYQLYQIAHPALVLDAVPPSLTYFDSALLAHRSFLEQSGRAQALNLAIGQAILEIVGNPRGLNFTIESLLANEAYVSRFLQSSLLNARDLEGRADDQNQQKAA